MTAVFVANDAMARGLLRALREAGRRVSEEVSVVGFDDLPESPFFSPPLTTVRQNFGEVGDRAFELLLERIGNGASGTACGHRMIEPELVRRDSTGVRRRS